MTSGRVPVLVALRGNLRRVLKAAFRPAFDLEQVLGWLQAIQRSGTAFGFPEDLNVSPDGGHPLAILKHDIHEDLFRAVAMARRESERSIHGIYFMLGPHPLNASFFGTQRSWEQLRIIQSLGHRIGLHFDVVDALERGGVYETLARTVNTFAAEGISLHYGNCHGSTKHRARGIRATDFFEETVAKARADAPGIADHLGKYSLRYIATQFGLHHWVDNRVLRDGKFLEQTLYVTDNNGSLRIPARNLSSPKFRLDETFAAASREALSQARSLILLHPQWYRERR